MTPSRLHTTRLQRVALCLASTLGLAGAGSARADVHLVPNPDGPLAGKTVVVSAGHGWRPGSGFQRGERLGLREDIHTNELVIEYLQRYLINAGARVETVRERSFQDQEVIVDDVSCWLSNGWWKSTWAPTYHGAGYRVARGGGAASAVFQARLPKAGRYPVYAFYAQGTNRTRRARYVIHHAGGRSEVFVDQRRLGDQWHFLGEFYFDASDEARVVVSDAGGDPEAFVIADAIRFGGGVGGSGLPRWQEGAATFLRFKGYPAQTWDDVTIRSRYATWLAQRSPGDYLYVAIHSNSKNGRARGLTTFSYSNGRKAAWGDDGARTLTGALQTQSDALRDAIHRSVRDAVRGAAAPRWPDGGSYCMNFGELRRSSAMPAALIELGFHDNVEDVKLLEQPRFRSVAARGVYEGILHQLAPGAVALPEPPEGLRLTNLGGGMVYVSWRAAAAGQPATSFKLYRSADGHGFDDGVRVEGSGTILRGLRAGRRLFVRVAALNAGGESLPGRVGGVQVGAPGGALVVDAFDRPFVHSARNTAERYSYDGSIAHVDALGRGSSTLGVDFAEGSAVHAGRVPLDRYDLVDWALGQNAPDGDAFDLTERRLLTAYVDGGGALLASGAELDWDRPVPLAPAAVADPRGPVVLGPPPPVRRARYGWREGEAVVRTGPQRVATVEFPLESVDDPAHRAAIAAAVLRGLQVRSGDGPGFVRVLGR